MRSSLRQFSNNVTEEKEEESHDKIPDPDLAKTSEYIKNLQEAEQARKDKETQK